MIQVLCDGRLFHLQTKSTSYVFFANPVGRLEHIYYGARVEDPATMLMRHGRPAPASFCVMRKGEYSNMGPDVLPQEYAGFNSGDMRMAALTFKTEDGAAWTDARFVSAKVVTEKRALHGLPSSFVGTKDTDVANLEVTLLDEVGGVEVTLLYSVFADNDVISRSAIVKNVSDKVVRLERAMSAQVDFTGKSHYEMVNFYGSWSRERYLDRTPLRHGIQATGSLRGATGHVHSPALILCEPGATETMGETYAFVLEYSGNHFEAAEVDQFDGVRVQIGIHPGLFSWKLNAGESFETPEMFMTRSGEGFGKMSRNLHDFMRSHLIRSPWNGKRRPILVNNWEATYFNFDTQKILDIAKMGAKLNIEMLVLDDGWFGHRDDDKSSLGDWFEFKKKIGDMKDLADGIHALGMKFGLWFEPEMISEDSELYRAHPEWVLCVPNRPRCYGRTQLILDFSRPEVVQHLYDVMAGMIGRAGIDYIKWDMNRNMSDVFSAALPPDQQGEVAHRYILGVYKLNEMLIETFPNLLIEGCSGGGGRFDAGMMYYLPQIWCSDNTNAMDRLAIQAGTSLIYPVASMGAHVNAQHDRARFIPFETRGNVAMAGTFGYELDLTKLDEDEQATAIRLNKAYHRYHDTISEGDYYRLTDMFKENDVEAWSCVAKDKKQAVLTVVRRSKVGFIKRVPRFTVPGLDPAKHYRLVDDAVESAKQQVFPGDVLMNYGLWCSELDYRDCASKVYLFEAID